MESLKPCPFCGERDLWIGIVRKNGIEGYIYCGGCDASFYSPNHYQKSEALHRVSEKWNTRTSDWISIEDALPANDNQYIAWVGERAIILFYCDDGYWCEHYGARDYSKYVTHWMPLPDAAAAA